LYSAPQEFLPISHKEDPTWYLDIAKLLEPEYDFLCDKVIKLKDGEMKICSILLKISYPFLLEKEEWEISTQACKNLLRMISLSKLDRESLEELIELVKACEVLGLNDLRAKCITMTSWKIDQDNLIKLMRLASQEEIPELTAFSLWFYAFIFDSLSEEVLEEAASSLPHNLIVKAMRLSQQKDLQKPELPTFENVSILKNLRNLLKEEGAFDVVLEIEGEEVKANKSVLACRCRYFYGTPLAFSFRFTLQQSCF